MGSKTAEKNSAQINKQTDRQTNRHYENNGHLAVNQYNLSNSTALVARPRRVPRPASSWLRGVAVSRSERAVSWLLAVGEENRQLWSTSC